MCGRYYIDGGLIFELNGFVPERETIRWGHLSDRQEQVVPLGEIEMYPTDFGVVILSESGKNVIEKMRWGFPSGQSAKVVFNARCETILSKPMFSESVMERRCIVPARGYYEWDSSKNRVIFRNDTGVMYMAGIYKYAAGDWRYVIVTTAANSTVRMVHDRMPLLLSKEQARIWLQNGEAYHQLLGLTPGGLTPAYEFLQQRFLFNDSDN